MTSDGLAVVQALFSLIWRFFTSWYIPGTTVTPAAAFLFFMAAGIGLRFFSRVITPLDSSAPFTVVRGQLRNEHTQRTRAEASARAERRAAGERAFRRAVYRRLGD